MSQNVFNTPQKMNLFMLATMTKDLLKFGVNLSSDPSSKTRLKIEFLVLNASILGLALCLKIIEKGLIQHFYILSAKMVNLASF